MLDLGWAELAFLLVLALVVVGPQDLPKLARTIGKLWGKLQRFYRDSLQSINKLETEMDLASQADPRNQPSYYDLLPEHVRRALEQAEPVRDAEQHQQTQTMYEQAMAEIKAAHAVPAEPVDADTQPVQNYPITPASTASAS